MMSSLTSFSFISQPPSPMMSPMTSYSFITQRLTQHDVTCDVILLCWSPYDLTLLYLSCYYYIIVLLITCMLVSDFGPIYTLRRGPQIPNLSLPPEYLVQLKLISSYLLLLLLVRLTVHLLSPHNSSYPYNPLPPDSTRE